ncbi:hypothetical protein C8R46DRAFT_1173783 [Mycena filopes]|nr:hypothetical protein C8R46DRAFT_1173783 [Mycena filopes]
MGYSYPEQGYSYPDQGYSSYGDQGYPYGENYAPGMYPDQMMPQSSEQGLVPQSHRLTGPCQPIFPANRTTPTICNSQEARWRLWSATATPVDAIADTRLCLTVLCHPSSTGGGYRAPSSMHIKFKRKGALLAGINLGCRGNDAYTVQDLHADWRRRIYLRVRWAGYAPLTYEVPLDVRDGRVSMQALSRRVARACVHYLQMNMVPVMYSRVELHHLEEISYGVWQPMLSTR